MILFPGQISSWLNFPERYKFTGLEILFDYDRTLVERSNFGLLAWMGELGGFE
jgi:hypothetical protein